MQWREQWIHQGCSGLSRKDIQHLAAANSYAFECSRCSSSDPLNPGREFLEVKTRVNHYRDIPEQEPKDTNRKKTRKRREPASWPHLDQETSEGKTRRLTTCVGPARDPKMSNELPNKEDQNKSLSPSRTAYSIGKKGQKRS